MRPALFIDRDGTLNVEVEYLCRPEDAALIPGAGSAIARANARGIPVIVVTNQAGIAKEKYGWPEYEAVRCRIEELLAAEGARIDGTYCCPYHEEGRGEYRVDDHPDRKPNPGMLLRAAQDFRLDLSRSWMIGDKAIDVEAGQRAGCRTVQVLTGYGAEQRVPADLVVPDLGEAIDRILAQWP